MLAPTVSEIARKMRWQSVEIMGTPTPQREILLNFLLYYESVDNGTCGLVGISMYELGALR